MKRRTYKYPIEALEPYQVFVFGSNTQGRHGKGAAKWALDNAGAIYGNPFHIQGQSFAIMTKDLSKSVHPSISSSDIKLQILDLYNYALDNDQKEFLIAYRGQGINLNGYTPREMASLFSETLDLYPARKSGIKEIPYNIIFEEEFHELVYK